MSTEMKETNRRAWISHAATSFATLPSMLSLGCRKRDAPKPNDVQSARHKASGCIFIWLPGGVSHIDTWDPKTQVTPGNGQEGSLYSSIETNIPGVRVCEHLPRMAKLMDRTLLLRSVGHRSLQDHSVATAYLNTGRPSDGSLIYPSLGSIINHELGALSDKVPGYVLLGTPSHSKRSGFLGNAHDFVHLSPDAPPNLLSPPAYIDGQRQERRSRYLSRINEGFNATNPIAHEYELARQKTDQYSNPQFLGALELNREPDELQRRFGAEFGRRCLLARRLIQAGVRFVDVSFNTNFVNGTGWDTHGAGINRQHRLISELDFSLSALIADMETHRLLKSTLIVVATEFGRNAQFDQHGGRDHWSESFSVLLAGAGIQVGQVIGKTDETGMAIMENPISVPDLHATIHTALGIDPGKELRAGERPVAITDHGSDVGMIYASSRL